MRLAVTGRVFSGMGKGSYYVGHPEYQRRFEKTLGYVPYPGTLNVKLDDEGTIQSLRELRSKDGIKVESFSVDGESFSSLNCYNGTMDGEKVTLLFIDVTYYNETVAELVAPHFLRGRFGLKDGQLVTFTLDVPG